ncbi:hypothetical protein ABVT39_004095 [Epinephelus coioides]
MALRRWVQSCGRSAIKAPFKLHIVRTSSARHVELTRCEDKRCSSSPLLFSFSSRVPAALLLSSSSHRQELKNAPTEDCDALKSKLRASKAEIVSNAAAVRSEQIKGDVKDDEEGLCSDKIRCGLVIKGVKHTTA